MSQIRIPIEPQEALKQLEQGDAAFLDVRSEGEFAEGHIPGFLNRPILNNDERHWVGLTYKKSGQAAAIEIGTKLVAPFKTARIAGWAEAARTSKSVRAIVICWRGGLRSKVAVEWLREAGCEAERVQGGYKSMRKALAARLVTPPEFVVLTGLTGTGKTRLLNEAPVPRLDLEGMANHRGSSFGDDLFKPQPPQATFENQLALEISRSRGFLVEDESRRIGRVVVPAAIKDKMGISPVVILESPIHSRVELIFEGYIRDPLLRGLSKEAVRDHMISRLDVIHKQLGGLLHSEIRAEVLEAFTRDTTLEFHEKWIRELLLRHYDPRYRHSFSRQERKILFQGELNACHQYLVLWSRDLAERNRDSEMIRA